MDCISLKTFASCFLTAKLKKKKKKKKNKLIEKSRKCHNHKLQPTPDTKKKGKEINASTENTAVGLFGFINTVFQFTALQL